MARRRHRMRERRRSLARIPRWTTATYTTGAAWPPLTMETVRRAIDEFREFVARQPAAAPCPYCETIIGPGIHPCRKMPGTRMGQAAILPNGAEVWIIRDDGSLERRLAEQMANAPA